MQLIIDIPEEEYKCVQITGCIGNKTCVANAIYDGIPLPKCHDGMVDYRRAFKIACELLNGDVLYGVDSDKIFEIMMERDGVVANDSYEEYILNHLQELDHGQYAESEDTDATNN